MIFQVIGLALGAIGYFGGYYDLLILGGGVCAVITVLGFLSGKLNPAFPVVLLLICYFATNSFLLGLLYSSLIGTLVDLVPALLACGATNRSN